MVENVAMGSEKFVSGHASDSNPLVSQKLDPEKKDCQPRNRFRPGFRSS